MVKLEHLNAGVMVTGLRADPAVAVVSVQYNGADTATVVHRSPDGQLAESLITRSDAEHLQIEDATHKWQFDSQADHYLLVLEAYRIDLAAMFDPRIVVHTSLVEPLPRQILAVYESTRLRTPLRFLLVNDPGVGKTIMAGLYIRELMVCGDLWRSLIVIPGSLSDQSQDELKDKFHTIFVSASG